MLGKEALLLHDSPTIALYAETSRPSEAVGIQIVIDRGEIHMMQRRALLMAAAITTCMLVLIGGGVTRMTQAKAAPATSATTTTVAAAPAPKATGQGLDPAAVQALIDQREASYGQLIQQANDRLRQAAAQQAELTRQLAQARS